MIVFLAIVLIVIVFALIVIKRTFSFLGDSWYSMKQLVKYVDAPQADSFHFTVKYISLDNAFKYPFIQKEAEIIESERHKKRIISDQVHLISRRLLEQGYFVIRETENFDMPGDVKTIHGLLKVVKMNDI